MTREEAQAQVGQAGTRGAHLPPRDKAWHGMHACSMSDPCLTVAGMLNMVLNVVLQSFMHPAAPSQGSRWDFTAVGANWMDLSTCAAAAGTGGDAAAASSSLAAELEYQLTLLRLKQHQPAASVLEEAAASNRDSRAQDCSLRTARAEASRTASVLRRYQQQAAAAEEQCRLRERADAARRAVLCMRLLRRWHAVAAAQAAERRRADKIGAVLRWAGRV